jgi:hypothetical protein
MRTKDLLREWATLGRTSPIVAWDAATLAQERRVTALLRRASSEERARFERLVEAVKALEEKW